MKSRNRAFQRQRDGWNQSPRKGANFRATNNDANNATRATENVAFTLIDEARQTSHHDNSFWSPSTQLRKKPVAFISSGSHDPLVSPQTQAEDIKDSNTTTGTPEDTSREKPILAEQPMLEEQPRMEEEPTLEERATQEEHSTLEEPPTLEEYPTLEEHPMVEERPTLEEQPMLEEQPTFKEQSMLGKQPTLEDASSSDEVIVFKGRNSVKRKTQAHGITLASIQTEITAVEKQLSVAPKEPPIHQTEEEEDENSDDLLWPRKKRDKSRKRRGWREKTEEDDMLADYIANMREHGEMMDGLSGQPEMDDSESTTSDDAGDKPSASFDPNAKDVDIDSEAEYEHKGSLFDDPNDDIDKRKSQTNSQSSSRDGRKEKRPLKDPTTTYLHSFTELEYLEEQTDFDVMDWGRPSLRPKKGKAGRLQLLPDDIDSEFEEKLQAAYSNDRQKKAQRKKEREELRAMGMLGKRGQLDLRVKYPTGITMSQTAEEIRTFLVGSQEILTLPPMDKRSRKMVHMLANKFNIKSKSIGSEDQRRPVLYRTKTTSYKEAAFEQAVLRIKRQYVSRPNKDKQKSSGRYDASTSYQDGEVIGAHAPELGTGNRGRTMLEKMGWSTGTPLGASDNQGILHPVKQTMKRTRAGLGQEA